MSEQFRVIFSSLAEGTDQQQASQALQQKLKLNDGQCSTFFNKQPLFAPSDKAKALKQAKAFAAMGIQTRLVAHQPVGGSSQSREEQIINALDYITSSLIRLEEKLDDLDARLQQTPVSDIDESIDEEWQDDLALDEELDTVLPKRNRTLLYSLGGVLLLLLVLLAVVLAFPDLITL